MSPYKELGVSLLICCLLYLRSVNWVRINAKAVFCICQIYKRHKKRHHQKYKRSHRNVNNVVSGFSCTSSLFSQASCLSCFKHSLHWASLCSSSSLPEYLIRSVPQGLCLKEKQRAAIVSGWTDWSCQHAFSGRELGRKLRSSSGDGTVVCPITSLPGSELLASKWKCIFICAIA